MTQPQCKTRSSGRPAVLLLVAAVLVVGGTACGGSGSTDPYNTESKGTGVGQTLAISVVNNSYNPSSTTVPRSSVVQWTWNTCDNAGYGGETCTAHTVSFDDGPSSDLQERGNYSRQFATAGTFTYHCKVHGATMSGAVNVQ